MLEEDTLHMHARVKISLQNRMCTTRVQVELFAQPYVHDACSKVDPPVNKLNFPFSGVFYPPLSPNTKLRGILPAAAFVFF